MYFLFKYFLTAVYDYDVLSKIKMAIVGVLIVTYFGEESWVIHLWSKETEHSQYNMDRYKNSSKRQIALAVRSLKKVVLKLTARIEKIWRLRNGRTVFAPTYFPPLNLCH